MKTRSIGCLLLFCALPLSSPRTAEAKELTCLVQPKQTVTVSFAAEGVVEEVLVERGDLVEEGQELARLFADVEMASLEVAKARAEARAALDGGRIQLQYADIALARQRRLKEQNVLSQEAMDEAQREQKLAVAGLSDVREALRIAALEVGRADAVLRMRSVRSPVRGVVVKRILAPTEWADPPQVLEIAQLDPLNVEVFAPLRLLGDIATGAVAKVMFEEPVGGEYTAKVTVVDRVVDAASGTFGVRLELPNPDYALPAGVRCRVRFAGLEVDPASPGSVPSKPAAGPMTR